MACFSTSLEEVVQKSEAARAQVENLQKGLDKSDSTNKQFFDKKRNEFFTNAGLNDVANGEISHNIKVEFASEFSLDKVIPVVKAAIDTAVAIYSGGAPIAPNTQKAFSDLVVAIGECAKFSSNATSSMSFATNRLSPGLFVSLYAASVSIEDKNMFGKKAVTATMYYYQLSKSNKDIEVDMMRELTLMYAEGVINLNKKILALAEQVADGTISMDIFKERRETIRALINDLKPSLASYKNGNPKYRELVANMVNKARVSTSMLASYKTKSKSIVEAEKSPMNLEEVIEEYNNIFTEVLH
jgi:hypothetical protein